MMDGPLSEETIYWRLSDAVREAIQMVQLREGTIRLNEILAPRAMVSVQEDPRRPSYDDEQERRAKAMIERERLGVDEQW